MSSNHQWYTVEEIVNHRFRHGIIQYQVKWVGYTELSWEPIENFQSPQLYTDYNNKHKIKIPKLDDDSDAYKAKQTAQEWKMRKQAEKKITIINLKPDEDCEGIPQKVLHLRQFDNDQVALVKFTYRRGHANAAFVPIEWLKVNCPSLLIEFFESHLYIVDNNGIETKADENVIHGKN